MDVKFALVCDYATTDKANKFVIVGVFDNITASNFPCTHPSFHYVAKLKYTSDESGKHSIKVVLLDKNEINIAEPIEKEIDITRLPNGFMNFIISFNNIVFPRPEEYLIELFIDGQKKSTEIIDLQKV